MLRVLGRKTSGNVQKIVWLLDEIGTEYEREDYGRQFGNTASAAYLSMNPTGKVPTLVDGDSGIWESNTILRYICAKTGSDFLPSDPTARARAETWMDWQLASLNAPYVEVFKETRKPEAERTPDLPKLADALTEHLLLLDGHLAGRTWLAGETITVAEFALGPIIHRCLNFPIDLPTLENLRAWHARLLDREPFARVVAG